jgi:hypothetical protein
MAKRGHVNLEMPGHGLVERWDQYEWIFQITEQKREQRVVPYWPC